jgi:protein involved in temperature-dependent protein secretion
MTPSLPPELMTPEDREARVAELEHRISREWIRFAVTEGVVLWLPLFTIGMLYVAEAVSHTVLVAAGVGLAVVSAALTVYWYLARIRPISDELAALRGGVDTTQSE